MRIIRKSAVVLAAAWLATGSAHAEPVRLAPFKDELFAYPAGSTTADGGDRTDVAYSELRDINGRDEVPERRVKPAYVDPAPLRSQVEAIVRTDAGPLKTMQVGERTSPAAIVVFVHGRNGDRRLGMVDRTFGGNFNRLKNLLARAGGLYATVDAGNFAAADKARFTGFLDELARKPGKPPIVLACASMGGEFCWDVLGSKEVAARISGVVMLAANNVPAKVEAMRTAAGSRRPPIVLVHGTRDKVFAWSGAEALYERLRRDDYPVRFVSMSDGNHGTPIRMIDWRATLNWVLANSD